MKYRHELKYICDQREKALLESRLHVLMKKDSHIQSGKPYLIKSIYFDDYDQRCIAENESGVDNRKKFRIRAYDNSDQVIKMEIKHKNHGMTWKENCILDRENFDKIILRGKYDFNAYENPVYNQFCMLHKIRILKPVCTIGYERTAYVMSEGNVRITFDENIFVSADTAHFFESQHRIPVLPTGFFVLEIKYDEFLPDHIRKAIEIGNLRQTAFSKYYLGWKALNTGNLLNIR